MTKRLHTRVDFSVGGHTISVDEVLEGGRELVVTVVRRRVLERLHAVQDRRHRAAAAFLMVEDKLLQDH